MRLLHLMLATAILRIATASTRCMSGNDDRGSIKKKRCPLKAALLDGVHEMFVRNLCGQPHPVFQDSASSSLPAPLYWRRAGRRRAALVGAQAFNLTNKAGQRMGQHRAGLFLLWCTHRWVGEEEGMTLFVWLAIGLLVVIIIVPIFIWLYSEAILRKLDFSSQSPRK